MKNYQPKLLWIALPIIIIEYLFYVNSLWCTILLTLTFFIILWRQQQAMEKLRKNVATFEQANQYLTKEFKHIEAKWLEERWNQKQVVAERTQALEKTIKQLEETNLKLKEANHARSYFISAMSHELRTPLNSILSMSDLLTEQFFGELNEKQMLYVNHIKEGGNHLLELINDLLDTAKIDAGTMEITLDRILPNTFIDNAVMMIKTLLKKKNIEVKMFIDPTLPLMMLDARRCKQIMLNILSNAVKYTPKGGEINIRAFKRLFWKK